MPNLMILTFLTKQNPGSGFRRCPGSFGKSVYLFTFTVNVFFTAFLAA